MKRLLTGGTTRQVATIVIISVLAAHGLSAIVWLSFDMRPGPPPEFIRPAAQIGLVLRLLDVLPAEDHAAIFAAAASGDLAVRETVAAPVVLEAAGFPETGLRHALSEEHDLGRQVVSVGHEVRPDGRSDMLDVVVHRDVKDANWLIFQPARDSRRHRLPLPWLSPGGVASLAAIPLLIGLISLWGARRVTRPLVRLAAATEGLSGLEDPSPVAEEGALEVRQVARAFNALLERLRRFVGDRTHMLAAISHDLRTPLTRLRLRAETVDDDGTRKKMLNDIDTMDAMIRSTLAFIREEALQEAIGRVDIAVLLQTICDEFADTGADVRYVGPLHCAASFRPQAFQRALNNLVDNAAKFGAPVTARLEVRRSDLVITVEDNGPGIPDAQREAVFRPFFRGDVARNDPQGGVGLGLSIVKTIVESHDGTIELLTRARRGLCVRLCMPHRQREPDLARVPAVIPAADRFGRLRQ